MPRWSRLNCTVHVKPDSCELWLGTQIIARAQQFVAKLTGLPEAKVQVHNHYIGGGFGRRLEVDMALTAVRIAQHVEGPVKVTWSREEDMQHDIYPALLPRRGFGAAWPTANWPRSTTRCAGRRSLRAGRRRSSRTGSMATPSTVLSTCPTRYPIFARRYLRVEPPAVTTGWWRGVGPNNNVFAIESFVDECARKLGKDPVAFRRDMLGKTPRLRAALDLVAEKSNWGKPLPARVGRGVCVSPAFASFLATVVEAEVDENGEVVVRRVTAAIDTGIAINPDTIEAQLQGGFIFGITAALYGEITIKQGPRAAVQLPRLSHAAHQPDADHRGAHHPERRSARRHWRSRDHCGNSGAA